LWVTAVPPSFDGGGGHVRQAHLLVALAERFDVHLLVAGECAPDIRAAVATVTEVPVTADPSTRSRTAQRLFGVRDLVTRQYSEVGQHVALRRAIGGALGALPPVDLVQVEFLSLWPLVRHRHGGHWAITLHNLGSGMAHQRRALAPHWRNRFWQAREEANARHAERQVLDAYDTTIVCSPEDAAALGADVVVVPNGVDLDRFTPAPVPAEPHVVFTGALYTDPNIDGVRWLVDHVWPEVIARRSDARLSVVGMHPGPAVVAACTAPGVTLHADVDSTIPFLHAARVAVVPLRVGTGSRLKALEAMAAGRPVVGTTIGLGGLALHPGNDVVVADHPDDFAAAVIRLLDDDAEAAALGKRGRRLAEAEYGWQAIATAYVDHMLERLDGEPPRPTR
jgi:glycosyltransferase involved in cell wall biosynthesis